MATVAHLFLLRLPISSSLLMLLAAPPMAPVKRFSAAEKGKARQEGPGSPPTKRGRNLPRKHPATPDVASRGRGGGPSRGGGRPSRGSPVGGGRRVVAARPPRPRFHSVEVLPDFVVWSDNPAGTWLQLPRSFAGELPDAGPGGL